MLAAKLKKHGAQAWLMNTGWTGGKFGVGKRMNLPETRKIIDAIHSGELANVPTETMEVFGLHIPKECPGVRSEILVPKNTWGNKDEYEATTRKLAEAFIKNF